MGIKRLDNVAIVVDDLDAAAAFFTELGMELAGTGVVEGAWADQAVGLDGLRTEVAIMRTPDGNVRLELTKYDKPEVIDTEPAQANTLGLHRIMFAVDDIDDVVTRLRTHGAELVGGIGQYEDVYRLCYLRGPAGILVALAEALH